jgi:hypothetical protein
MFFYQAAEERLISTQAHWAIHTGSEANTLVQKRVVVTIGLSIVAENISLQAIITGSHAESDDVERSVAAEQKFRDCSIERW